MPIDNGGPAFPRPIGPVTINHPRARGMNAAAVQIGSRHDDGEEQGMSLRDWFAGQALPALMGAAVADAKIGDIVLEKAQASKMTLKEYFTIAAYEYADAMLAGRAKSQEKEGA